MIERRKKQFPPGTLMQCEEEGVFEEFLGLVSQRGEKSGTGMFAFAMRHRIGGIQSKLKMRRSQQPQHLGNGSGLAPTANGSDGSCCGDAVRAAQRPEQCRT